MAEFKANKAGRRPFPIGTLVDVIMRMPNGATRGGYKGACVSYSLIKDGEYAGHLEVTGAVVGDSTGLSGIRDWKLDGITGDVLAYRKHEGEVNEQG